MYVEASEIVFCVCLVQLEWVGDLACDVQWPPSQCSVGTDYLWYSGSF